MANFNKKNPCPICGKPDWCGYDIKNGKYYVFCHRTRPLIGSVINGYYCFKVGEQCGCFETVEQHEMYSFKKGTYKEVKPIIMPKIESQSNNAEQTQKAPAELLDVAYREFLSILKLEKEDEEHLKSEGWDDNMIIRNQIKSFPYRDNYSYENKIKCRNLFRVEICRRLVGKGISLEGVPGFGMNEKDKWTFYGPAGIVFPIKDFTGKIVQLRIRPRFTKDDLDYYEKEGKKPPKYMNFNSEGKKCGTRCGGWYGVCIPKEKTGLCFITEGEKKGIVIAEKRNAIAITIQGVSSFNFLTHNDSSGKNALQHLKDSGIKIVAVCYDSDKATNKHVLGSEREVVKLLKESGFQVAVCNWNPLIAKGIDDLIWKGLNPSITILK